MDMNKLFNAGIGKVLLMGNTDEEYEAEIETVMNMSLDDLTEYIQKEVPPSMRKLKLSTLFDIAVNVEAIEKDMDDLDLDDDDED